MFNLGYYEISSNPNPFHFTSYVVGSCSYICESWNPILNYLTLLLSLDVVVSPLTMHENCNGPEHLHIVALKMNI